MSRTPTTSAMVESLSTDVQKFINETTSNRVRYQMANILLIVSSILIGGGITVASIFNQSVVAAVLGAFVSVLVALHNALSIGPKADFFQRLAVNGENLLADLKHVVRDESKCRAALEEFKKLRLEAVRDQPRREGVAGELSYVAGRMTQQDETPQDDMLEDKRYQVGHQMKSLNQLVPLLAVNPGDEQQRAELQAGVTSAKLTIMRTVWGPDWGGIEEFTYWAADQGARDPIPQGLEEAAKYYRATKEAANDAGIAP